jgi:hypothetical protein
MSLQSWKEFALTFHQTGSLVCICVVLYLKLVCLIMCCAYTESLLTEWSLKKTASHFLWWSICYLLGVSVAGGELCMIIHLCIVHWVYMSSEILFSSVMLSERLLMNTFNSINFLSDLIKIWKFSSSDVLVKINTSKAWNVTFLCILIRCDNWAALKFFILIKIQEHSSIFFSQRHKRKLWTFFIEVSSNSIFLYLCYTKKRLELTQMNRGMPFQQLFHSSLFQSNLCISIHQMLKILWRSLICL